MNESNDIRIQFDTSNTLSTSQEVTENISVPQRNNQNEYREHNIINYNLSINNPYINISPTVNEETDIIFNDYSYSIFIIDNLIFKVPNEMVVKAIKIDEGSFIIKIICSIDSVLNFTYLLLDNWYMFLFFIFPYFGYLSTINYNKSYLKIYLFYLLIHCIEKIYLLFYLINLSINIKSNESKHFILYNDIINVNIRYYIFYAAIYFFVNLYIFNYCCKFYNNIPNYLDKLKILQTREL
jgi:hypothetical protein